MTPQLNQKIITALQHDIRSTEQGQDFTISDQTTFEEIDQQIDQCFSDPTKIASLRTLNDYRYYYHFVTQTRPADADASKRSALQS